MNTFEEVLYVALYEAMEQAWDQAETALAQQHAAAEQQDCDHA